MKSGRVHRIDIDFGGLVVGQDEFKFSRAKCVSDDKRGQKYDTESMSGRRV